MKAMLVLNEMPDKCEHCLFHVDSFYPEFDMTCLPEVRDIKSGSKPDWCPLTDLPDWIPLERGGAESY